MKKILSNYFFKTALASCVLIASAFLVTQYNHYKDLRDGYLNTAQRISQALSSQFSFFYHNAQNITYNRSVRELNKWEAREYFDSLVALYPHYDMIILSDMEGNYVASNTIGSEGEALEISKAKDMKFHASGHDVMASEDIQKGFLGTFAKDFAVNDAISAMYGRKKFGMSFSAVVRSVDGRELGQLTTFINRKWLENELRGLSEEFLGQKEREIDVFLLNKDKKTLASNKEVDDLPLSDLPFKVTTANFSKHTQDGNIMEGVNSFAKFLEHPFFIVSKFNHQNFLSDMGWSLVIKMNKEQALASIINSLAWFWGAFLLFIMAALGIKSKAVQKLEGLWRMKEREGEISFEEALERANFKEVAAESLEIISEMRKQADINLPGSVMAEAASLPATEKLWQKARGGFDAGLEELQVLEAGRASFSLAIEKRKKADKVDIEAYQTMEWNLEKAKSLLHDLRVHALNVEIADSVQSDKARELDSVVEKVLVYFEEARKIAKGLKDISDSAQIDLANAWRVEEGCFFEAIEKAREAFGRAQIKSDEMGQALNELDSRAQTWNSQNQAIFQERKRAGVELNELISMLGRLERLLSDHTAEFDSKTSDIKKAA